MATTRQNVSLRRRRRRSTIESASSDIVRVLSPSPHLLGEGRDEGTPPPARLDGDAQKRGEGPLPSARLACATSPAHSERRAQLFLRLSLFVLFALALERGAQNVAERRAGV